MKLIRILALVVALFSAAAFGQSAPFQYFRHGNAQDVSTYPDFGIAMMGGGTDLDEAFRWLCEKGNGGDFLILRARGDDAYNPYVAGLCKANSVATLIIPDRATAQDPHVSEIIKNAEVIFIAGGDQARYINFWKGTPAQEAINAHIAAQKPIGGTSAGLAVLSEFVYGALGDKEDDADLSSREVLADPYIKRVTVVRDFLKIPMLQNTLTDSHFAKRDRMGRSLGFLARIVQDGWSKAPREIAIDEKSALLVEANGRGKVVGTGKGVYFLQVTQSPEACEPGQPLTMRNVAAYHAPLGAVFDISNWTGKGADAYSISVEAGKMRAGDSKNPYR